MPAASRCQLLLATSLLTLVVVDAGCFSVGSCEPGQQDCVADGSATGSDTVVSGDGDGDPGDGDGDVTLAVVLLDLSVMGQDAFSLANIPLNPPANDVPFSNTFPYLAPPN